MIPFAWGMRGEWRPAFRLHVALALPSPFPFSYPRSFSSLPFFGFISVCVSHSLSLFFQIVSNGSSIYRTNLTRVLLLVILCTLYRFPFASHDQFLSFLSASPPPSCTLLSVLSHYLLFIFQYPTILLIHVLFFMGSLNIWIFRIALFIFINNFRNETAVGCCL